MLLTTYDTNTHTNHTHTHTHTHELSHSCMITDISGIRKHTTMNELTFYQITLFNYCLKTLTSYLHLQHYACVDEYYNCSVFMVYQSTLVSVCLITHITNIRALNTMPSLMSYQTALLTECLTTYITVIKVLPLCMRLLFIRLLSSMYTLLHTSQP